MSRSRHNRGGGGETDRVSPYPSEEYGFAIDGTPLRRYVVTPNAAIFPPPWPCAIAAHVGGFKNGSALEGNLIAALENCAAEGILGFSVQYRMDKQLVGGQPAPVFWPCEADDYKQCVVDARLDDRVIPTKVFGIGGSTGADLALHACCDTAGNPAGFNDWTAADRLKFAVLLSGPFNFADRTANPYLKQFVANVNLYCQTTDLVIQAQKSSITAMGVDCPPLYVVHFSNDSMPISQFNGAGGIVPKITALGLQNCANLLITGTGHAFDGWPSFMANSGMTWITDRLAA